MGWPVEFLQKWMSDKEFNRWCQYFKYCPFDDQSNHHVPIASLQSQIAHAFGGKAKLTDFLVFRKREDEGPVDLDAKFRRFFEQYRDPDEPTPSPV